MSSLFVYVCNSLTINCEGILACGGGPWSRGQRHQWTKLQRRLGQRRRLAKCHFGADFDVFSLYGNNILICLGRGGGDLQNVIFFANNLFLRLIWLIFSSSIW